MKMRYTKDFKFRLWDTKHNQMMSPCCLHKNNWTGIEEPNRFTPMQWTGLKDFNGQEIYEGDILDYGQWSDGNGRCRHIVEWIADEARFGTFETEHHKQQKYAFELDVEDCEVIGNIYENPELAK